MFDPAQIHEYQRKTVPTEWKADILAAAESAKSNRKPRIVAVITSLAACLVLLVVGGVILNAFTTSSLPAVSVSVNHATPFTAARSETMSRAQVTLTADGTITAHSSSADLCVVSDNGEKTPLDNTTVQHSLTLEWTILTDSVEFTANGEHFRLTFDAENGNVNVTTIVPD